MGQTDVVMIYAIGKENVYFKVMDDEIIVGKNQTGS